MVEPLFCNQQTRIRFPVRPPYTVRQPPRTPTVMLKPLPTKTVIKVMAEHTDDKDTLKERVTNGKHHEVSNRTDC